MIKKKNKAAPPQPPLKVSTILNPVQGGKKKHNRFVCAHVRFGKAENFARAIKSNFCRMGMQFPIRQKRIPT